MWDDTMFSIGSGEGLANAPEGFVMAPDEAKMLLSKLRAVRDTLSRMHSKATRLCRMQAPSQDPSTLSAHVAMTGDGNGKLGAYSYGGGHIDRQIAYIDEFVQRIEEALGMTKSSDQHQAGLINSVKPQEPAK